MVLSPVFSVLCPISLSTESGEVQVEVSDYLSDFNTQYDAKNRPLAQGEWGAIGSESIPARVSSYIYDRLHYLIQFYKMLRDNLIDLGKMTTFNYWGGWEGQNTSILTKTGSEASSQYSLDARGKILASFFKNSSGSARVPVVTSGPTTDTYAY